LKRPLVRGFALTAAGSAAVAAVSLVRNVIVAHVMGPAAFGLWQWCALALRFTVESHLGALSVLTAEAAVHRGAGRTDEARDMERRAVSLTVCLALVAAAIVAALFAVGNGPATYAAAGVLGATVVLQQQFFADCSVLRSRGVFGRVAVSQVVFAAVHLAGLALLVPGRFVTGALISWALALAAAVAVMRGRAAEPMPPARPALDGASLVRRGVPAYLVGLTFTVLLLTDRVVVGTLLGTEALGFYGPLTLLAPALIFVPDVLGGVLWPVAGEQFGRAGEDPAALSRIAERSVRGLAVLSAGVLATALAATDVLVEWKLPNFASALPAARPYLAGVCLLALTIPLRSLLVTARAGRPTLTAQMFVLALAVALECAACTGGGDRIGDLGRVATASAAAAVVLLALMLGVAAASRVLAAPTAVRLFVEAVVLAAAALALDHALRDAAWWARLAVPASLAATAAVSLAARALRGR
jgi:O-antigen/teichoic acid export membrane protein